MDSAFSARFPATNRSPSKPISPFEIIKPSESSHHRITRTPHSIPLPTMPWREHSHGEHSSGGQRRQAPPSMTYTDCADETLRPVSLRSAYPTPASPYLTMGRSGAETLIVLYPDIALLSSRSFVTTAIFNVISDESPHTTV